MTKFLIKMLLTVSSFYYYTSVRGQDGFIDVSSGASALLYKNNQYSKRLHENYLVNWDIKASWYLGNEKKISIGFFVKGFAHGPESDEEGITPLVLKYGPSELGDILLNSFTEFSLGPTVFYDREITNSITMSSNISCGVIYPFRSNLIYNYSGTNIVYHKNSKSVGFSLRSSFGVYYKTKVLNGMVSIGVRNSISFGSMPFKTTIFYGDVNEPIVNHLSYEYENNYLILNYKLFLAIRASFDIFNM